MLETHCIFDVNTDILAPVTKLTKQDGKSDAIDAGLRVVGQEQDGCLLYTWVAQAVNHNSKKGDAPRVTHVGLYNPVNKTNKTLFVHETLVEIVNCSISQEHTFLGFVTLEQAYISEGYGRRQKQDHYHAYLAEVAASPEAPSRIFYLNLERSHYLRLQFLYGLYHGQVARREAHLLVLLHRESIGLYHIPMARVGADGVIVSGEPKKDQIFQKRFVWSQWDPTHQRLYVAQFRRQHKTTPGSNTAPGSMYRAFLTGYQFTETTANQFMLDVPLDLPFPSWKNNSQRSQYEDPAPHNCIPDSAVNMCVVTRSNGTMCVCFQHPPTTPTTPTTPHGAKAGSGMTPPPADEWEDEQTLQYSIAMLHNGQTLTCSGLQVVPGAMRRARLLFVPVGDYLAVHLPGQFTHLLNVGIELEPCHHILWHEVGRSEAGADGTGMPRGKDMGMAGSLLPLVWDRHAGGLSSGAVVYDPHTQRGYRISICRDILVSFFVTSGSPTTRLALLHYAVLHQRDLLLTRMLFESLLTDTACPELVRLLEEFLIGSTYAALRGQMELYVMRLMPFTCATTFQEQTETESDGSSVCSITYTALGPVTFGNLSKVKGDHKASEMWRNLVAVAGAKPASNTTSVTARFSSRFVQHHLEAGDEDDVEFAKVHSEELPSWLQKLATATKSALTASHAGAASSSSDSSMVTHAPSRSETLLGRPPAFLSITPRTPDHHQEQLISLTNELLLAHLKRFLKRDSCSKIRCLASEYITCQMQQSRHLAHLLCTLLVPEDTPAIQSLDSRATPEEYALFQCMERYHLALEQQAFPHPPGFPLYLASLAYRCLPFSMFKQYVDSQVVQVTQELMERLITEVPDNAEMVPRKMSLLCKLPPAVAIMCARHWDHPVSRRFLATRYSDSCLNDGEKEEFSPVYPEGHHHIYSPAGGSPPAPHTPHGVGFPPLATLIAAMERKVSRHSERAKSRTVPVDRHLLEEVGLAELYAGDCHRDDILTFG